MKFKCPLIVVDDIDRARKFYTEVLNQKVQLDFGENITFEGPFAIHLKSHFQKLIQNLPITNYSNHSELYFEHDDVLGLQAQLEKAGVRFVHKTIQQPWKQYVMRFYDPDGNLLEIGESMEYLCKRLKDEGLVESEICSTTGLPIQFVKNALWPAAD
jgi:catechol 2,3-dioxygenase-like lactoylglutathione lyase family enzyme